MTEIEREKQTVCLMIDLYCRHHLKQPAMTEEYRQLAEYACRRLDHCRYGEAKTACKDCPTHCYGPEQRQAIREVMRWVGPRMILFSPRAALRHVIQRLRTRSSKKVKQ